MHRIVNYIDNCFSAIPKTQEVQNMKANIYEHMTESFQSLIAQGKNEDEAFGIVVSEFGSMDEILKELNIESPPPEMNPKFKEEYLNFQKQAAIMISVGIGILVFGLCVLMGLEELLGKASDIPSMVAMLFWAVAIVIFVYYGITAGRYESMAKNTAPEDEQKKKEKQHAKKITKDNASSIIMLSATGIFLVVGFLFNAWHPAWILFPVGGILCGIVDEII